MIPALKDEETRASPSFISLKCKYLVSKLSRRKLLLPKKIKACYPLGMQVSHFLGLLYLLSLKKQNRDI